jgi:Methyltransferase domain
MGLEAQYYLPLAAAFVRGRRPDAPDADDASVLRWGLEQADLRLSKLKRKSTLPRVGKVLGILRGLSPSGLVDVGSGRGTFLWPLLDAFATLPVTAIDNDPIRARDLEAIRDGGQSRLTVREEDARASTLDDGSVDVMTVLEVLEHLPDPHRLAARAVAIARRFVVVSVPSKPDDNPDHIQLFSVGSLRQLLLDAGAQSVDVTHVRGHMVAVARAR